MAEFQDVARHWKRMCKKYWGSTTCHGCPIAEYEHEYEACSSYKTDAAKMEELVMSWAAEHPEPVYPSWAEWLGRTVIGVDADSIYEAWRVLCATRIPADIAEKLGIEPKEGV